MRRRDCISLLGALTLLRGTTAESRTRPTGRQVGIITAYAPNDTEIQPRLDAFTQTLLNLGDRGPGNTNLTIKSASGNMDLMKVYARELVEQRPDVILSATTPATAAVLAETRDIPVVFVSVSDPVGSGFVKSFSRPDKNATGFVNTDPALCAKWVEILKEIVPHLSYAAIMYNPRTAPYSQAYIASFNQAAREFDIEPGALPVANEQDVVAAYLAVGRRGGGIVLMNDSFNTNNRLLINALTREHKVPTISYNRQITAKGGLISYGVDEVNVYTKAAHYIHRILHGETIDQLPVQAPELIHLTINIQTAKLLGITLPKTILVQAHEIFE
ncbi:ABC transporter substrate-binding protein [Methylobacterium sp. EM32]|uniref:ABC transporter substrate-binding protein n=1 Tax=Methylobacterium sp. EM32 TaxID=3163481 RepID=UPI0033A86D3B